MILSDVTLVEISSIDFYRYTV